ncbi:hypothetical protein [Capnocytophaga sputigena]
MKILLTITLSLLLFSCDNSVIGFKKSCNAETAKQTVAELAEVKAKIKQLETLIGNNPTYWVQDSIQRDNKTYYRLRLLNKLSYTDVHLYTFVVPKDNCKQVFLEQKKGTLLPYVEIEKQTKQAITQQKQFPAFFKQFITDIAFRQQHLAEPLLRLLRQKDGSVLLTEEELLIDEFNELQTYNFSYYPDSVLCENTEKSMTLVFIPIGNTWKLTQIWH